MRRNLLNALISIFLVQFVNAQISIDSAISVYKNNYPQEKIVLQTDKDLYTSGETIWLKTWCTLDGIPTYLSRIIYVDLVDANGVVVVKKMYKADSLSSAAGDLDISNDFKSGNYVINAYSLWMLNFPEFITKKNIYIYGPDYRKVTKGNVPQIKMFFFPEGGELIAGVENRIAFKIVDQNGYPVNLNGTIIDKNNKQLSTFETKHDGMGYFSFVPEIDNECVANIKGGNGVALQFKLPKPLEEGIAVKIDNSNLNRTTVFVNRTERNKYNYSKIKVVAQINGKLVYGQLLNLDDGQNVVSINKKGIQAGVMQLTFFTENDLPIAERLIFISNYTIVKPEFIVTQFNKQKRSLNKVDFMLPKLKSSISIKIVDGESTEDSTERNESIVTQLLLTSDLKGYINNPGYYFKDKSTTTISNLDLLLMTQGWRRFQWKKILKNDFPTVKYPVESAMYLSGLVTKSDRSEIIKSGFVSFVIKTSDSATILAEAKITDKGEFLLSDINFLKKASIAYMGTNENKKNYIVDVKIYPTYFDSLKKSLSTPLINADTLDFANVRDGLAAFISGRLKSMDTTGVNYLGNVTVKAKKISPEDSLNRQYAEGPFLMGRGINPNDFKNYRTIWQIIQSAVPGVTISGDPFNPDVSFNRYQALNAFSDNTGTGSDEMPGILTESNGIAYFLNGQNVFKDVINTISVDDVAFIKVLKQEASVLGATQGAIAIYTKEGTNVGANPYDKTFSKLEKQGYSLVKEFYNVDYYFNPMYNKNSTDNRYLLYWNPKPLLGKDGKYHIKFFSNDYSKKYKLLVQGLDINGSLILGQLTIQ